MNYVLKTILISTFSYAYIKGFSVIFQHVENFSRSGCFNSKSPKYKNSDTEMCRCFCVYYVDSSLHFLYTSVFSKINKRFSQFKKRLFIAICIGGA